MVDTARKVRSNTICVGFKSIHDAIVGALTPMMKPAFTLNVASDVPYGVTVKRARRRAYMSIWYSHNNLSYQVNIDANVVGADAKSGGVTCNPSLKVINTISLDLATGLDTVVKLVVWTLNAAGVLNLPDDYEKGFVITLPKIF